MKSIFDKQKLRFECPKCGHGFTETVAKLKTCPEVNCPSCGAAIAIEDDGFVGGVREADKEIENLRKSLARASKKLKF